MRSFPMRRSSAGCSRPPPASEDTLRRMEEAVADAYDEVKHSRAKFRSALSAASGGPAPRSQPAPRRAMYDAEADEDED